MLEVLTNLHSRSPFTSNSYREFDFQSDLAIAEKYGAGRYIWLSRDCGSLLFPLLCGIAPSWLEAYKGYEKAEWFLIEGQTVRSISSEQAIDYAHQTPKLTALNSNKVVRQLLEDDNVTASGLVSAPKIGTERSTWPLWLDWFKSSGNLPMQRVMAKAMKL